jgi:heme exporter protein D
MGRLAITRLAVFGITLLFSLVILGLCAHVLNATLSVGFSFYFASLGIASAVLTIISLGPMLVIDHLQAGAVTSLVWVELLVLVILWILWVATSAQATTANNLIGFNNCSILFEDEQGFCNEFLAIQGISFVIWIALLIYIITLIATAIRASQQGHRAWTTSVTDGFDTPAAGATTAPAVAEASATHVPTAYQYPPQQHGQSASYTGQPQMAQNVGHAPSPANTNTTGYQPTAYDHA